MSLIEVRSLCFAYTKDSRIFEDITFSIEAGTINVILGLNGSGKTTLIKLLAGLMKSTGGSITVDGKPILAISDHERSKLIAYVPQLANSRIAFTTKEYLMLSLTNQKSIYWRPDKKDREKVVDFANRLGIDEDKLDRRVDELSGGERQIVMICGALLQDAKIIILDEPTAALDMKNQYRVLQFLKKSYKKEHKTIVFSCHDPNHALRLGGNMIALHKGAICLQGESRKIIKAENLKCIYGENVCDSKDSRFNFITIDW
ncbi:MAG: ABC transporter ATP-binding protein [Spirochaetaceae bacterium]|jgi:iron complex transport system ATP-binding protein|nr:ABC transporter ATP-binding protein [Spirochaetaceae bacterium]